MRVAEEMLGHDPGVMKRRRTLLLRGATVASMIAGLLVVGGLSAASAAPKGSVIQIGSDLEQSGPASAYGEPQVQGAQLYISQVDAKGGVDGHKIVLDEKDNQTTNTGAVSAFDQLAQTKNVVAVFGPSLPSEVALMETLARSRHLPLLSFMLSPTDQQINANPYWFRIAWSDPATIQALLAQVKKNGGTSVGVIYPNDAGGTEGWAVIQQYAASYGLTISGSSVYQDGVVDPTSEVLSVSAGSPSAYVVWDPDSGSQLGLVVKTIRDNGITAPIYVPESAAASTFEQAAGSTINNVYYWASFSPLKPNNPLRVAFVKAFKAKYGALPTDFSAAGYAQAQALVQAITIVLNEKKPATGPNVEKAMESMKDFQTVYGDVTWTKKNHAEPFSKVNILEYRGGIPYQVVG